MGLPSGLSLPLALLAVSALAGCQSSPEERREPDRRSQDATGPTHQRPVIGFALIAATDPGITYKTYQPLMDHLTAQAPFQFQIRLGKTTDDLMRSVEERMAELAPLDVVSYLEAHEQFGAVPLVKPLNHRGEALSRAVFFTRKDGRLRSVEELKGGTLALGEHHSTLSNLVPRHELLLAGIQPDDLATIEHMSSDDQVVAAVLEGRFDAGAAEDVVVEAVEGARIFHISEPIPTAPLVVRDDLPKWVAQAIRDALLQLDTTISAKRKAWAPEIRFGFRSAKDSDYEPVRKMTTEVSGQCGESCHSSVEFSEARGH